MLTQESKAHLRAVHRALWKQDNYYRISVLAAPVLLVIAIFHLLPSGGRSSGPPFPSGSPAAVFPAPASSPSAGLPVAVKPPEVIKIAPASAAKSGGYQSPFNQ